MKLRTVLGLVLICLFSVQVVLCRADTFTTTVAQESDDAVEYESSLWGDGVSTSSLDVYFGNKTFLFGTVQEVATGLLFQNVTTIPAGAHITSARIEMTREDNNDALDVTIYGQKGSNPATFSDSPQNISSRTKTTSTVHWKPDSWLNGSYHIVTSDLKDIVQEIVNDVSWAPGNNMAFIFSGSGSARAKGYSGWHNKGPKLVIDYTVTTVAAPEISITPADQLGASTYEGVRASNTSFELSNTGDAPLNFSISDNVSWLNCSVTSGTLAAGASLTIPVEYSGSESMAVGTYSGAITITDTDGNLADVSLTVQLTVKEVVIGSVCGDVPLYAQNLVNPAMLIELDISGSMDSSMYVLDPVNDPKTPDLKTIVQEIVNQSAWADGNAMVFKLSAGGGQREAITYDKAFYAAPLLHVEYDDSGTTTTFEARVTASQDDAEEGGWRPLTSNDLDIGSYLCGVRFQDVTIPQGATITSAYLQFSAESSKSGSTSTTISGELSTNAGAFTGSSNDISNRPSTTSTASWSIPAWTIATRETRLKIAKDTLKDLVEDRTISWGFGSWTGSYSSGINYTKIHDGVKQRSVAETGLLQADIDSVSAGGGTPLQPSMLAGQNYFAGTKEDLDGDSETTFDSSRACQPKFLIEITDGIGNTGTTLAGVTTQAGALADDDVNTIAIGFGIDNATQLQEIARISNERGDAASDDDLYALHDEDASGVGQPFLAMSGNELKTALDAVTSGVKEQLFYGSSPAPSTSVDHGNFVINAQFNAANWSGDLIAKPYDPETGALTTCKDSSGNDTCDPTLIVDGCICWTASDVMPATKSAWTVDSAGTVVAYTDATLASDNYICKDFGDIIRSTPVIVESPRKYYSFDNYRYFKYGDDPTFKYGNVANRDAMVYVGSNDGALHALDLTTGIEQWRFYPEAVQDTLNKAQLDSSYDPCDLFHYCHRYMVDGSPVVADVFKGSGYITYKTDGITIKDPGWRTLLVNGLGNGGGAYFALDITSPKVFDDSDPAEYLWQFEDTELGFATSTPVIDRVTYDTSSTTFGGWAVYFGSGFDTGSSQATKEAYAYGIEAYSGDPLWGTTTNRVKLEVANLLAYDEQSLEFQVGDTVTGATSGATGVIGSVIDSGTSGQLVFSSTSGTFQDNELLLGPSQVKADADGALITSTTPNSLAFDGKVASFMSGETVSVSGVVTATIDGLVDNGADGTLTLSNILGTGTFSDNDVLQGNGYALSNGVLSASLQDNALSDPLLVDMDYNEYAETLYFGDLYGKMYRVLNIGKGETPSVSLFYDIGTFDHKTPIRAGGAYAYSTVDDTVWIYFGTGKYEEQLDKLDKEQQYFYGIKDSLASTSTTVGFADLVGLTATSVTSSISGTSAEYRVVTGTNDDKEPWYVKLVADGNPSERVIANPLVAGGLVFFTTFVPDNDVCGGNGQAWLYALDYETGLAPDYSVFDINGDGYFNDDDKLTVDGTAYFIAAIPIGRGIPTAPVLEDDIVFVNTTDNSGTGRTANVPDMKATMRYWRD